MAATIVPELARLDRVELAHAGTWHLALGGEQTFTGGDFAAAVAALDCPAIPRPIVKLGHFDPRTSGYRSLDDPGDGEPALGWVANMGLTRDRGGIVGDLVGMPAWLGRIAASAYPNRSIEGCRNYRCSIGHTHPFVLSAVALLGVTPPAIGTLGSLQDHVRALYGVAASTPQDTPTGGEPFAVTFTAAAEEASVPNTRADLVAAAATVDELRTAFHQTAPYDMWITEVQLSPLQLIVTSDNGGVFRVPVTVGADGDSFSFGAMVPVEVTYVDDTADETVAAAAKPLAVRFATRAESRPQQIAAAAEPDAEAAEPKPASVPQTDPTQDPTVPPAPAAPAPDPEPQPEPTAPADPAAEPETTTTTEEGDDMSLSEFASRLGLDEGADKDAILAALDEKLKPAAPDPVTVAASAQRDQEFAAALSEIKGLSTELAQIKAEKAQQAKDAFFAAAVQQGKIRPADRGAWETRYDKAPEVITDIVGAMAAGSAVPVAASGYVADPDEAAFNDDDLMALMPPALAASMKAGN